MKAVLDEIAAEREKQDARWGGPAHDDTHDDRYWLRLINARVWSDTQEYRRKLVEIAALAVAAIEVHDRRMALTPGCFSGDERIEKRPT